MSGRENLGELEQIVLLVVLQLGADAQAIEIRDALAARAGRRLTRGALYRTLERLTEKGMLDWKVGESTPERGGLPRRDFRVTKAGIRALRASRRTLLELWSGLDHVLDRP